MGKYPLKHRYECQAVRGCPNRAFHYNDSPSHDLLYCHVHRIDQFKPNAAHCNSRQMFTKLTAMNHARVIEWGEIAGSFYALHLEKFISYKMSVEEPLTTKDINLLSAVVNFMSRDLRLFEFYLKLANFQVINIDVFRSFLINDLLDEDISYVFLKYREVGFKIMNNPDLMPAMDMMFEGAKIYLQNADRNSFKDRNKDSMDYMRLIIKSAPSVLRTFPRNIHYIELLQNSVLLQSVNSQLFYKWKANQISLKDYLGVKSDYVGYMKTDFNYFYTQILTFQRLGEYRSIFKTIRKAEAWLNEQVKNIYSYKNRLMRIHVKTERLEMIESCRTKLLYVYGVAYFDMSLYHKSLYYFGQYLKKSPSNLKDCQNYIALIFMNLKDFRRALKVAKVAKKNKSEIDEILGLYQLELGNYDKAYTYFKKCGTPIKKASVINHIIYQHFPHFQLKMYKSTVNKGLVYYHLGQYKKALEKFRKAMTRTERVMYIYHPYISEICNCIGMAYEKMHEYDLALFYYYRALDIEECNFTKGACVRLVTIIRIGSVFIGKGNLKLAMAFLKTAKDIIDAFSTIHSDHAEFYYTFGRAFQALGDLCNARKWYYEGLRVDVNRHGFNHLSRAWFCLLCGSTIKSSNTQFGYFQEAVVIVQSVLGRFEHPIVAIACERIGDVYWKRKEYEKAKFYYRYARNLLKDFFPEMGFELSTIEEKIITRNLSE